MDKKINKSHLKIQKIKTEQFIPTTMPRLIGRNVVFRPLRSWHSNTFAGEGLFKIPNSNDSSGCLEAFGRTCMKPYTVTHRIYWNRRTGNTISAFLSYPDAMGMSNGEYFWETLGTNKDGDIERFFGPNAERQMEQAIIKTIGSGRYS